MLLTHHSNVSYFAFFLWRYGKHVSKDQNINISAAINWAALPSAVGRWKGKIFSSVKLEQICSFPVSCKLSIHTFYSLIFHGRILQKRDLLRGWKCLNENCDTFGTGHPFAQTPNGYNKDTLRCEDTHRTICCLKTQNKTFAIKSSNICSFRVQIQNPFSANVFSGHEWNSKPNMTKMDGQTGLSGGIKQSKFCISLSFATCSTQLSTSW